MRRPAWRPTKRPQDVVLATAVPGEPKANAADRALFLAVRQLTFTEIFEEPVGKLLLDNGLLRLVVFDEEKEEILQWLP